MVTFLYIIWILGNLKISRNIMVRVQIRKFLFFGFYFSFFFSILWDLKIHFSYYDNYIHSKPISVILYIVNNEIYCCYIFK